jgi:cytochrome d ubiquinol oxidase subunit I
MAVAVTPVQIIAGDMHGLNTLEYQPMKIAAMEGHYETRSRAPLILFGMPDNASETTRYAIEIPKLGSIILKHDPEGTVQGLKNWPKADWPNTPLIFWSFRVMVGLGFAMLGLGIWSLIARRRGGIEHAPWLQRAAVLMGPSGFIAVLAGWVTTESGRQPYTVYGLLRTAESLSPIATPAVGASLVAFVIIYFAVFGAGTFYILRMMSVAPTPSVPGPSPTEPTRAAGIMPAPAQQPAVVGTNSH